MHLEISIKDRTVKTEPPGGRLIANGVGVDSFSAAFDAEWDDYTKVVIFEHGTSGRCVSVLMTEAESYSIPHEVLTEGRLYISAVGYETGADGSLTERITTRRMVVPLTVYASGAVEGTDEAAITPTLYEQLIGDLEARIESGELRGDTGPQGPPGEPGVPGEAGAAGAPGADGSDAQVTQENITAALGYTPAAPQGDYELIEEITLAEDTTLIERTMEPDTTPYSFDEAFCIIKTPPDGGTNAITAQARGVDSLLCYASQSYPANRIGTFRAFKRGGYWWGEIGTPMPLYATSTTGLQANDHILDRSVSDYPICTCIRLYTSGANVIPSGTSIKIYGVRA